MYNEEALKSIYKYNMLFNNISNNNNTEEDAKYNTNLISDFDLENFDPKRYEYYTGLLKVFNNDPETLYNLLNKYNSIKSLKVKEKKIIREINDYVNKIKDINDNNPVDGDPAPAGAGAPAGAPAGGLGTGGLGTGGGRGTGIKTIGGAGESNEIEKIKSKIDKIVAEAAKLIKEDPTVFASVQTFLVKINDDKFENWKNGLSEKTIINPETRTQISIIKEAINKFKGDIAFYNENHEPMKGGTEFKELLTNSDKEDTPEKKTLRVTKDVPKKLKLEKQREHEKNVLAAEKLVLSAEKLVVQIENAITYISDKNNKVKDGLDDVFSELDKNNDEYIKKEELENLNEEKARNKETDLKADSAIGLLNNVINANIGIGSELYKVASQEQQGTVSEKKTITNLFSRSSTPKNVQPITKESNTKETDKAIEYLKDAVAPSISVSSKLYDVANTGSKEIKKAEKADTATAKTITVKLTETDKINATAANSAIDSLKDAIAPSISIGNELYKVADEAGKAIEAGIKKTEKAEETIETQATTAANSAIDSLKDAIAPSISVSNELYKVADDAGKAIKKKAEAKEATNTKAEKGATTAAILAINSLKDAVAPSISVGNELYKVAEEANKAIKNEATEVDSAEANFIESIKGTALLNSISNIFDKFKGIEDLDIEKISPATAPTSQSQYNRILKPLPRVSEAEAAQSVGSQEGRTKSLLLADEGMGRIGSRVSESESEPEPVSEPVSEAESESEAEAAQSVGSQEGITKSLLLADEGMGRIGGKVSGGGDPNQKYSDDNLKAQYLDTQRYNKIDDNKIINEYRERLSVNKNKVGRIKTDNKIEQLSNDIDVYNTLDFDEKESKEKTDNIIKKIKDFENDPKNPIEALELSFDDRIVFIIATFFIRYITIIMVQWCIDINIIKSFYEGFIYYAVIYIILFWFIVLFINIDNSFDVKYMNFNGIINSIRTLFYYFYMGTNGISRLLIHTSLILLLIVIPIILNIKKKPDFKDEDDQESIKILDYEERKQLSKALSLFTMFIWLFTSIIATKF